VGGDRIALSVLVGPDSDPHVYEPKPADAMRIAEADIVLVNGLAYEGFLQRLVLASGTRAEVVELTQGIAALEGSGEDHDHDDGRDHDEDGAPTLDPHAWQSVAHARRYVE